MEWILMALLAGEVPEEYGDTETLLKCKYNLDFQIIPGNFLLGNICHMEYEPENETVSYSIDEELKARIASSLDFKYKYSSSLGYKSKLSITDIKKMKNQGEENTGEKVFAQAEKKDISGNELGTAMHKIMECISFADTEYEEIEKHIEDLFAKGIIEERFRGHINYHKIQNMICSPLGRRMYEAELRNELFREQQFYISMKASDIYANTDSDECIVVQGIIDAYFVEAGEAVLIDYKTDHTASIHELVDRYHVQLDNYGETISRLRGLKVKEKLIYAFHFDEVIACP
jgi:ATP-dependent helicase/nuclease subunit A